jgi:DNA-binding MarR family transcriptional regulator
MAATRADDALTQVLRQTILALVRRDEADLTSRQFGAFLTVYLTAGPLTVRRLAAELNASKPAITRALDRLGELSLARRKVDPMDRRSVLISPLTKSAAQTFDTSCSGPALPLHPIWCGLRGAAGLCQRAVMQPTQAGDAFLAELRHVMAVAGTEHLTAAA